MGALSCSPRLSSAAGIWFPGSWCGCRWIPCGPVTLQPGARVPLSQVGAAGGGNTEAFSWGSRAEPAGKAICPHPRALRACWQGEGRPGQQCQALAGLAGGWASWALGDQSCLDTRGVLRGTLRAWLCLPPPGAAGGMETGKEGGDESVCGRWGPGAGAGSGCLQPLVSPHSLGSVGGEGRG